MTALVTAAKGRIPAGASSKRRLANRITTAEGGTSRVGGDEVVQRWVVLEDAQRAHWEFIPHVGIGPIRFDMSPEEVRTAVVDVFPGYARRPRDTYHQSISEVFSPSGVGWGGAVTAYYDAAGLVAVSVHARLGPQVTFLGMDLVCRVPSEIEDEFVSNSRTHGYCLQYGPQADAGSSDLGIVLRTERAGDHARSRPVFVAQRWTETCVDAYEGRIPREEWTTFLS